MLQIVIRKGVTESIILGTRGEDAIIAALAFYCDSGTGEHLAEAQQLLNILKGA